MQRRFRTLALVLGTALLTGCGADSPTGPEDNAPTGEHPWPGAEWEVVEPAAVGMDAALLAQARDYALTGGGAGMVVRHGRVVAAWGDPKLRYEIKSVTKAFGALLLGVALVDGRIGLDDTAQSRLAGFGVPPVENEATGWLPAITLRQLAAQTAGFTTGDGYGPVVNAPGTTWLHSDVGVSWLGDVLTVAFQEDLLDVLRSRALSTIGVNHEGLTWRTNRFREPELNGLPRRELGSGIHASMDALARLGYLYLRKGSWKGTGVVPASYIDLMCHPDPMLRSVVNADEASFPGATNHYGLMWWTNTDGALVGVPDDAYFAWGHFDSVLLIIPSLDIVAVRAGGGWRSGWDADYSVIAPFIEPIASSVLPVPAGSSPANPVR